VFLLHASVLTDYRQAQCVHASLLHGMRGCKTFKEYKETTL